MQKVTLNEAEMDLLHAGGNYIKVIVGLRKRTGVGLREAKEVVDKAIAQKPLGKPRVAPPVQAPVARKPVTPSPERMKALGTLLTEGSTKPPVTQKPVETKPPVCFGHYPNGGLAPFCGSCPKGDTCRAAYAEKKPKAMEKPETRLLFQAKAGKHNPRVSLSEVEAMTRGEAEKGALAEAVASVTRWGVPLTIQLNTKDRKGHKGSGRRVRISRE